jgi:glycosyltransferase involved in cell wall biosynthesis
MKKKNEKERIIFFLPVFTFGGASESILKLSKFLIHQDYSISLISIGKNVYKNYLKKIGCDVIELNTKRAIFSIITLRALIKKDLKAYSKIILISNIHYANIVSLISSFKLKNVKTVLTERSSLSELFIYNDFPKFLKNRIIYYLVKFFYKYANLVITNSKFEKNFMKKFIHINNIKTIYPASILKVKKNLKNKMNINKIKKIIYVGRLSKEKGVITILKAVNIIKNHLDFVLQIYGDGIEKKNIKNFIKINHLNKNVLLNGFCKNKKKIYSNADLFINASSFEGLPNALVQSINNNIFPICSRAPGGNLEVIKNGKLGLSFLTNDSVDLANKIKIFFAKKLKMNELERINHLKNFTEKRSNYEYLKTLKNLK